MGGGGKRPLDEFDEDRPVDAMFKEAVQRQDRVDKGFGPKGRVTRARSRKKMSYQGILTKIASAIREMKVAPGVIVRVSRSSKHLGQIVVVVSVDAKELKARPLDLALGSTFTMVPGRYDAEGGAVVLNCEFVHAAAPWFAPAAFFVPMNRKWKQGGIGEWLEATEKGLNPHDWYVDSDHPEYGHFWRVAAVEARLAELERLKAATKKRK